MNIENIIFDVDGTLWDSTGGREGVESCGERAWY